MSEDNQENGTANGDVPEIELIIKEEINSFDDTDTESNAIEEPQIPVMHAETIDGSAPTNEYVIFELKTDSEPMYNFVITNVKKPPPDNDDANQVCSTDSQNDLDRLAEVEDNKQTETKVYLPKTRRSNNINRLPEAVNAVVRKELTISRAASVYQVTKSTLWKEVNKHTNHCRKKVDNELNRKIADRICAGESLSGISRSLKVAKSTLHQHKVRLAQSGQLPPNVTLKPPTDLAEKLALKERILQAFRGYRVYGMSIHSAARFYSVPSTTLWKHIRRFAASQHKVAITTEPCPDLVDVKPTVIKEDIPDEEDNPKDTNDGMDLNDFDVDAYCEQRDSEDGEFLISFDFDTFEEFVKSELA